MTTTIPSISTLPTAPNRETDDATSFATKADAMMTALTTFDNEMIASIAAMNTLGGEMETLASTAVNAPGSGGTSTTSLLIGTGSKALTTQTGKSWGLGQWVIIAETAAPSTNWMLGQITAYNSGTGAMTVNVQSVGGSGTIAAWTIALSAPGTGFATQGGIAAQTYTAYTTGGTSTAYTLTPSPVIGAYAAGYSYFVTFHTASGAAPTLTISTLATPPNLVKQRPDGTYENIAASDIPTNHRSRVTLLSATQALVEDLPAHKIVMGTAVATTSGTSIDFTSIPSWSKKVTISFSGVSTSGTSPPIIQLGDSGGIEATGYLGAGGVMANAAATSASNESGAFIINGASAANVMHGSIALTLIDSSTNTWAAAGVLAFSNTAAVALVAGSKSLSAALDRVRITTAGGADTFDAGKVNFLCEG